MTFPSDILAHMAGFPRVRVHLIFAIKSNKPHAIRILSRLAASTVVPKLHETGSSRGSRNPTSRGSRNPTFTLPACDLHHCQIPEQQCDRIRVLCWRNGMGTRGMTTLTYGHGHWARHGLSTTRLCTTRYNGMTAGYDTVRHGTIPYGAEWYAQHYIARHGTSRRTIAEQGIGYSDCTHVPM